MQRGSTASGAEPGVFAVYLLGPPGLLARHRGSLTAPTMSICRVRYCIEAACDNGSKHLGSRFEVDRNISLFRWQDCPRACSRSPSQWRDTQCSFCPSISGIKRKGAVLISCARNKYTLLPRVQMAGRGANFGTCSPTCPTSYHTTCTHSS